MSGFGEKMRAISLNYVPTAILSRQVAVIRKNCLIINLPGRPRSIAETLDNLFEAVPYCLELIGAPRIHRIFSMVFCSSGKIFCRVLNSERRAFCSHFFIATPL